MNSQQNTQAAGGIGFAGLLTIAFIVLRLAGVIDWNWWWVLSPLWITVATVLAIVVAVFPAAAVVVFWRNRR